MKIDTIIIAEAEETENFYPFSILHCLWEIRTGYFKLYEKVKNFFPDTTILFSTKRKEHLESFIAKNKYINNSKHIGNTLVINASTIFDNILFNTIVEINNLENQIYLIKNNDDIALGYISEITNFDSNKSFDEYCVLAENYSTIIEKSTRLKFLWDTLDNVVDTIQTDVLFLKEFSKININNFEKVAGLNSENILVGENVSIAPGVVLDASEGKIIIGNNTKIMANAVIIGPTSIGDNCTIKIAAKIYENCVIGNNCKIGGELENTIIQSFSNKQHDGFLGHSYLCEWVNFGADTNNSDLKNTYSNIKVNLNGKEINTERMFLGLLCGDHTKTGINSMFTTGTVCGIAGILVREWFLPNFISSFSWGGSKKSPRYKVNKAIDTAKTVMARRGINLLAEEEKLMRLEYNKICKK